jgi:hypothetical protein
MVRLALCKSFDFESEVLMSTGKKILRWLIIVIAVLVIIASVAGIVGTWWLHNTATEVTLRAFSIVDTAVGVVDAGANRANDLVQRGRAEVQQVESTIVAVGANIEENNPLLTALSNRISERLAPTVEQVRTVLTPVTGTVRAVRALVDFVNAIPFIRETPPAVEDLETALNRLDETAADVRQVNDTIRAAVTGTADRLTNESVDTLTGLTGRVDSRLAETQASVEAVQTEIKALQARLEAQRARLLLIYNLTAIALTLFMLWVLYSQVVVIRHQRMLLRTGGKAAPDAAQPAAAPPVIESPPAAAAVALPATEEPQAQVASLEVEPPDPQPNP